MFVFCKNNVVSYDISGRAINLPSYHEMSEHDVEFISNEILKYINR